MNNTGVRFDIFNGVTRTLIPLSASLERLFSNARDVLHYIRERMGTVI